MKKLRRGDGVSKFWWWNRLATWAYHVTHGINEKRTAVNHLDKCKYCSKKFDEWRKSKKQITFRWGAVGLLNIAGYAC